MKKIILYLYVFLVLIILLPNNIIKNVIATDLEEQDLTDYTEQDSLNRISYNETRVTISNMKNGDDNIYLYRDFGSFSNFNIDFEFRTPNTDSDNQYFRGVCAGWSDTLGDFYAANIELACGFYISGSSGYPPRPILWNGSVNDQTVGTNIAKETIFYCYFNRTGSNLVFQLYSDSARTNLVQEITNTGVTTSSLRYFYVAQSPDIQNNEAQKASWWSQNYVVSPIVPSPPTNPDTSFDADTTTINLTWSKGVGANNTIIMMKTTGYPTNITDGEIWYNGTNDYYENNSIDVNTYYYIRGWSEHNWSNPDFYAVSLGNTTFEYGIISLNCYDENTSNAIGNWGIFIDNVDGSQNYQNSSVSNPHNISIYQIPTGDNTIFIFNATGYSSREYYYDIEANTEYTFDAFLSWSNLTNLYYILVTDQYDHPVDDARLTIFKYINGAYRNISILKTNGQGQASAYLQVGSYKIKIEKDGYNTSYDNFNTDPDFYGLYYPIPFKIYPVDDEITVYTFTDLIDVSTEWQDNDTLEIIYLDNSLSTLTLTIRVYETNGSVETLKNTFSYTTDCNTKTVYVSGLDYNNSTYVKISITHSLLGTFDDYTILVLPKRTFTIDTTDIAQHLEDSFGDFELGYVNFFFVWSPGIILLLGLAAVKLPGMGIMGLAFWCAIVASKVETTLEENLYISFSLLILLGILALILKKRGDGF